MKKQKYNIIKKKLFIIDREDLYFFLLNKKTNIYYKFFNNLSQLVNLTNNLKKCQKIINFKDLIIKKNYVYFNNFFFKNQYNINKKLKFKKDIYNTILIGLSNIKSDNVLFYKFNNKIYLQNLLLIRQNKIYLNKYIISLKKYFIFFKLMYII